jgi:hypothetical protein
LKQGFRERLPPVGAFEVFTINQRRGWLDTSAKSFFDQTQAFD